MLEQLDAVEPDAHGVGARDADAEPGLREIFQPLDVVRIAALHVDRGDQVDDALLGLGHDETLGLRLLHVVRRAREVDVATLGELHVRQHLAGAAEVHLELRAGLLLEHRDGGFGRRLRCRADEQLEHVAFVGTVGVRGGRRVLLAGAAGDERDEEQGSASRGSRHRASSVTAICWVAMPPRLSRKTNHSHAAPGVSGVVQVVVTLVVG